MEKIYILNGVEISNESEAKKALEIIRWGSSNQCPRCGQGILAPTSHKDMDYWCKSCRSYCTYRTGTILHSSWIPCLTLIQAAYVAGEPNKIKFTGALGESVSPYVANILYFKFHKTGALAKGLTPEGRLTRLLAPRIAK